LIACIIFTPVIVLADCDSDYSSCMDACAAAYSSCTSDYDTCLSTSADCELACDTTKQECEAAEATAAEEAADEAAMEAAAEEAAAADAASSSGTAAASGSGSGTTTTTSLSNPLKEDNPIAIIGNIIRAMLGVVGAVTLLMFLYGGFMLIFSAGEQEKLDKGRKTLIWSIIGLAIVLSSYSILSYVFKILLQAT
jgi:cobalamin biosynthesis Mg chelatase CobN